MTPTTSCAVPTRPAQTLGEPIRSYVRVIRARFLHAMATHNIEDAVSLAFEIGAIGGHDTERGRANGRNRRRVLKASVGRIRHHDGEAQKVADTLRRARMAARRSRHAEEGMARRGVGRNRSQAQHIPAKAPDQDAS